MPQQQSQIESRRLIELVAVAAATAAATAVATAAALAAATTGMTAATVPVYYGSNQLTFY